MLLTVSLIVVAVIVVVAIAASRVDPGVPEGTGKPVRRQ